MCQGYLDRHLRCLWLTGLGIPWSYYTFKLPSEPWKSMMCLGLRDELLLSGLWFRHNFHFLFFDIIISVFSLPTIFLCTWYVIPKRNNCYWMFKNFNCWRVRYFISMYWLVFELLVFHFMEEIWIHNTFSAITLRVNII